MRVSAEGVERRSPEAGDTREVRGHATLGNFEKLYCLRLYFVQFDVCHIEIQAVQIKVKTSILKKNV